MARETVVTLVDDLDGTPAEKTVRFGIDGTHYEIDLSSSNARALDELLRPYVAVAGRTTRARGGRPPRARRPAGAPDPAAVRAWARANGWDVPDRGRIAAEVLADYHAAGN
jgi:hypothetical protein